MIIVYSNHITNRLKHTVKLVFEEVLHCRAIITDNLEEFNSSTSPKVNYSPLEIKGAIQIIPNGLLFENDITEKEIPIGNWDETITLFPNEGKLIPFDIFAATFYLTSRYEEYTNTKRDH